MITLGLDSYTSFFFFQINFYMLKCRHFHNNYRYLLIKCKRIFLEMHNEWDIFYLARINKGGRWQTLRGENTSCESMFPLSYTRRWTPRAWLPPRLGDWKRSNLGQQGAHWSIALYFCSGKKLPCTSLISRKSTTPINGHWVSLYSSILKG